MAAIRKFFRKLSDKTFLKYFLSYFLLFSLLLLGFFFIIRSRFATLYYEQLVDSAQEHLDGIMETFSDEITSLTTTTSALDSNINFILLRYKNSSYNQYLAYRELLNYNNGRSFIDAIVYLDKKSNNCVSSSSHISVSYEDGVFLLLDDSVFLFDIDSYLSSTKNQLLFLSDGSVEYLIYLPCSNAYSNHLFFYIINTNEIVQLCKSIASSEMPALALVDSEGHIIAGINTDLLRSEGGSSALHVSHRSLHGCNMVALISTDVLLDQMNHAFGPIYLLVLLLSIIGILVILSSMRNTYLPLKKMTHKLVAAPDFSQEYLAQLEQVFTESAEQNRQLTNKLDEYRLSVQKHILDSIVSSNQPENIGSQPDMEQIFSMEPDNFLFAVRMQSPGVASEFPCKKVIDFFREMLPGRPSCMCLDLLGNTAAFLVNYPGAELHKDEVLRLLLLDLYRERGYLSAISNSSLSPMDIPALYEHALQASSLWEHTPVVFYQEADFLVTPQDTLSYPYSTMTSLSAALKEGNFTEASGYIKSLFQIIDHSDNGEDSLPLFFTRCILIDTLSTLMSAMNHSEIKFKSYSELYFETLFYCHSCPYTEKREEIQANIQKLLTYYEACLEQKSNISLQLKQMINENYMQPDFSLTQLADRFQISIAYVSYLINKETGQNFTDYVWELRLAKAKELLDSPDGSIDEISVAVGYLNTSSFRRKFKKATGITPSQYRSKKNDPVPPELESKNAP